MVGSVSEDTGGFPMLLLMREPFPDVDIMPEQEELLVRLVEAARAVPSDERENFLHIEFGGGDLLFHPGFPVAKQAEVITQDLDILYRNDLLDMSINKSGNREYWLTPLGFRYYQFLKTREGSPIEQIGREVRSLIESEGFATRYPEANARWLAADQLLWRADSDKDATTIGHLCREAMQAFATELLGRFDIEDADQDPAHVVARIRAVLEKAGSGLGATEGQLLEAILNYWGAVTDITQRQEHGAQREGEPLVWEDSRRVVFQTGVVFYEFDRSLARVTKT